MTRSASTASSQMALSKRRVRIETAVDAAKHGREVEAEPVDAGIEDEMAKRVEQ